MVEQDKKIGIVGLGYVGLPLLIELSSFFHVVGFDIDKKRVDDLNLGKDTKGELDEISLKKIKSLKISSEEDDLKDCNFYIVTVPTPINSQKKPNLEPLREASSLVGKLLSKDDIVVYESTVYPGVTEEFCVPILENISGLVFNQEFFVGYSPERINPGDNNLHLKDILKVTSGSTEYIADVIDKVYLKIITAGTYKAPSIKVAEACKVVENIQRDVNIALVNELHQIFSKINIDTKEVIEAASTKWNFMKLFPGLVGGHCISVDPYYLLHQSKEYGYMPELMRTARSINDSMAEYLAIDFFNKLNEERSLFKSNQVAILGFTFKENCSDIRNTKVYDLVLKMRDLKLDPRVYDPRASKQECKEIYGINIENDLGKVTEEVCFLAVGHTEILDNFNKKSFKFIYDFKGLLD